MTIRNMLLCAGTLACCAAVTAGGAGGAPPGPTITWWTVDCGGGTSIGGGMTLSGTIGQADAGPALTGGSLRLTGGFWVASFTPQCGPADMGSAGGVPGPDGLLDNNDFIAFINFFFANNPTADVGVAGGGPGSDGLFDNNDFIAFINLFFDGCP